MIIITHIILLISGTSSEDGLYNPHPISQRRKLRHLETMYNPRVPSSQQQCGDLTACPADPRVPGGERAGGPGSGQSQV